MEVKQKRPAPERRHNGNGQVWFIGGVAVVALLLAWAAFNRSGQDLFPTAINEAEDMQQNIASSTEAVAETAGDLVGEVVTETEIVSARIEARAQLLALHAKLEVDAGYENAQQDLRAIEAELAAAYQDASDDMQAEYQVVKENFDSLGDNIQEGTGDVLEEIAQLALLLEADVRSDE